MSSWNFIIDGIRFSFSSVTSFETCRGGWKLNYIDKVEGVDNFFSQYGKLVHDCLERFFRGELEYFELSSYYRDNYKTAVTARPPSYPKGMGDRYRTSGQEFFDGFSFPLHNVEVLAVEASAFFNILVNGKEIKFIAKPDLIYRTKATNLVTLVDFKTSNPFKSTVKYGNIEDKRKTLPYYKQLYTYTHSIKETMGISVDALSLWFPRAGETITVKWKKQEEDEAVEWLRKGIENISKEEEFPFNKSNEYFCVNLCAVRHYCPLWHGKLPEG